MIDTALPPARPDQEHVAPTAGRAAITKKPPTSWDYFAGAVMVLLGIFLGVIAAFIVALVTGLIPIC